MDATKRRQKWQMTTMTPWTRKWTTAMNPTPFTFTTASMKVRVDPSVDVISPAAFQYRYLLAEVGLPEGLEMIGNDAFSYCRALKKINIPSTIIKIENRAFQSCSSLTAIFLPQGLLKLGEGAFENCNNLIKCGHWTSVLARLLPLELGYRKTKSNSRSTVKSNVTPWVIAKKNVQG